MSPTGVLDVFLDHEVGLEAPESLDHALGRLARLGEHDANALRAFQQFDHDGSAADQFEEIVGITRGAGEPGDRQPDALARQQLQRPQLVP